MKIIRQSALLSFVKPYIQDNPVIVEVGAFIGHDTERMANFFPNGTIHAFEPVPLLYDILKEKTKSYTNIKTYHYAVSDKDDVMTLYLAQKTNGNITQASSLQKPKERLQYSPIIFPTHIQVPAITLVIWSLMHDVSDIDLLWLDTQGHEMVILKSISALLPHIKAIYTEVGFTEAYEGQEQAAQVIEWLCQAGFTPVAQDFSNPPTWFFGNILFVKTNCLTV